MDARRRTLKRWVRPLLGVALAVAAVVFVRSLHPAEALSVIADADLVWVVLAMVLNGSLRIGTRVLRTRALLSALPGKVSLRDLASVIYGSIALGYIVSPIAGSAARVFALQRHGVPTEGMVAVQLWEKTVAGCALAGFAGPMLLRDTQPSVHYALFVATLLGSIGAVVAAVVVAGFRWFERGLVASPRGPVLRWFLELGRLLSRLHDAPILLRAFLWSLISEAADVLMLALTMHALGVPVDPAACVLGYIAVNMSSAVPSTPGQLGVFEAAAAWALIASGVPESIALACGLIYHVVHIVPALLLGLPSLLRARAAQKDARATSGSNGHTA